MSLKKKSAKGVLWNSTSSGISQLINFSVYILLARLISVEEFGLVAFAFLLIEFVSIFMEVGINQNLLRRKEWCDSFASSSHCILIILSTIISFTLIFIVSPISAYYYSVEAALIIIALSSIPIANAFRMTQMAKLQRDFENKKIAAFESISILIGSSISIILAIYEFGAWSIVIGRIIQSVSSTALIKINSKYSPKYKIIKSDVREIFNFGIPLFNIAMLTFFANKMSDIVIGFVFGPIAFGFVSLAKRIFQVFQQLSIWPISKILDAMIPRVPILELPMAYYRVLTITVFALLPVYLGMGAIAEPFIRLAVGEKWLNTVAVMQILSLAAPPLLLGYFLPNILVAQGLPKVALKLKIITVSANIILPLLAYKLGLLAVVASSAIGNYLTIHLRFFIVKKFVNIDLTGAIKMTYPFILCSFIMYFTVQFADQKISDLNDFYKLIILISIGMVSYIGLLFILFRRKLIETIEEIKSLI